MFCLMDVSGSMDQSIKDMAKRFYLLLYMFLKRHYEKTDIVFIRHHTVAKEVEEQEFFYSRETGGTVVSSALKLMTEIIDDRYSPNEWNIYGAQASDGDNWNDDSPTCSKLLREKLLPMVQYFAYVEITKRSHQATLARVRSAFGRVPGVICSAAHPEGFGHLSSLSRFVSQEGCSVSKKSSKLLSEGSDWTFELIETYDREIGRIARTFGLDTYPNQIEVIRSDQMMDAYSSIGMPIGYNHWSFGKHFVDVERNYQRGLMGLAYEIVINSNPCIAYLMEENSMTMQALVIAHACYGHNSFFKGNYLFRTWTDASAIIDYLVFAKKYISDSEERYGSQAVEEILDSCHALMNYGVDRYKRPHPISAEEEKRRQVERAEYVQRNLNTLWRTIPQAEQAGDEEEECFPKEPQENLLYFVEKNAPLLEPWQREIVRIVRKVAQYFYPQRQTQVMNEGWASFWHYTLLNQLYDEGLVNDGFMMEFLASHSAVMFQPSYDHPGYRGINPYALGFAMYSDLRRICENPTAEDRTWFPDIAGGNWLEVLPGAMRDFKDESFILQFLSPKVMRDLKLFGVVDDDKESDIEVSAIHDSDGYRRVRELLAGQYNLGDQEPNIQVVHVDLTGDRSLTLQHTQHARRPLGSTTEDVLKHLHRLWGFPVRLESVWEDEVVETALCPA